MARKLQSFGPIALTNTYGTNILAPAAAGASAVGYTATASRIILYRVRVVNITGAAATCRFFIGASGATTAGTEFFGYDLTVDANDFVEMTCVKVIPNGSYLVGGASAATTLTFDADGEVELA